MSGYADADCGEAGKRARPLYLELRALELKLWVEEDDEDPTGYKLVADIPESVAHPQLEELILRARENRVGLIEVLLCRHDPDLDAVRGEGSCG